MFAWPIPVPPVDEQQRIVDEVECLESMQTAICTSIIDDLARCDRLRQAVLKWAFEGKLVDQDPNDEPAEKLLARIRAERTSAAPAKKFRGRKVKAAL